MLIGKVQRHTFGDFHTFFLTVYHFSQRLYSPKEPNLISFPKNDIEKMKPYPYSLTKLFLYLGIWVMFVLNNNFSKTWRVVGQQCL